MQAALFVIYAVLGYLAVSYVVPDGVWIFLGDITTTWTLFLVKLIIAIAFGWLFMIVVVLKAIIVSLFRKHKEKKEKTEKQSSENNEQGDVQ